MRVILLLLLLIPIVLITVESQEPAETPPDLEVGEVSTSKFRTYEPMTHARPNTSNINRADTSSRASIYREEIRNRNSIENRSRDMLDLEQSVMRESVDSKPTDVFRYRVGVKNTGMKIVKFVILDYQVSYTDDFAEASHRQFRCTAKIKPNESEHLEGFSLLPPIRLVSAARDAKPPNQRVVINRIDYADGSSWQRSTA